MKITKKIVLLFLIIAFVLCLFNISHASSVDMDKLRNTMKYSIYVVFGIMIIVVTAFLVLFRKKFVDIYSTPRDYLIKGIASVYLVNPNYINDPKVVKSLEKAGIDKDEVVQYALMHEEELTNQASSVPKDNESEEAVSTEDDEEDGEGSNKKDKSVGIEDIFMNTINDVIDNREARKRQEQIRKQEEIQAKLDNKDNNTNNE